MPNENVYCSEGSIKVGDRLISVDGHTLSSVSLSEAQNRLRATTR